jgi:methionyl-tRNA formyltransferase
LRVVFLGTPQLAVPALERLQAHQDFDITLVVTQPDRPSGRGRRLTAPPIKDAAIRHGIALIQPESLRDTAVVDQIRATAPDVLVVVAFGEILRRSMLQLAPLGCVNVHPSMLPRYRGASPIPAAILNGDAVTGVSIMQMARRLDAGPVLSQQIVAIEPRDTTGSLSERLALVAADMLPDIILRYARGDLTPVAQDEASASYTREWSTADAQIDWRQSAVEIDRLIRAADPWPVAWTRLADQRVRILDAEPLDVAPVTPDPGTAIYSNKLLLAGTASGVLLLRTVQPPGKRPMPAADWWRGLRIERAHFDQ